MCTYDASQHQSCRAIQVLSDYTGGKQNWWLSYWYLHRWSGCHACFDTQVKEATSECGSVYTVIRREMLASRDISPEPHNVLQDVIKIINHTKVHALTSHLCMYLCEDMDAGHTQRREVIFIIYLFCSGFVRVYHWSEFLSYESCFRDFF